MRSLAARFIAWAFCKFAFVLRLRPGDCLIVFDPDVLEQLCKLRKIKGVDFAVPLIDGHCSPGNEHEIIRKLTFEQFNRLWNMVYHSYAEEQWKIAQDRFYLYPSLQKEASRPLKKFLQGLVSIKSKLAGKVEGLVRKLKEKQSNGTLRRPGLIAGKGEKQLRELVKKQSKPL